MRAAMTEVWYADLDDHVRLERLVRRHVEFGKTPTRPPAGSPRSTSPTPPRSAPPVRARTCGSTSADRPSSDGPPLPGP
ncbi:hypothetical protein ACFQYP_08620 [Nonomuraea antimicrobica]